MKTAIKLLAVVGAAAMLGGCQSFPLTSWMFKKDSKPGAERQALAGNTVGALEEGGAFLRAGNVSAAVASYRIALLDHATRADASNGLAVAYARLGRDDLAERYFMAAIAADPENPKFVANLLRLQQQVILARRAGEEVRRAAAVAAVAPLPEPARPVREVAAGPRTSDVMERVSRGEVQIRTRLDLGNAPRMALAFGSSPSESAERATDVVPVTEQSPEYPTIILFGE